MTAPQSGQQAADQIISLLQSYFDKAVDETRSASQRRQAFNCLDAIQMLVRHVVGPTAGGDDDNGDDNDRAALEDAQDAEDNDDDDDDEGPARKKRKVPQHRLRGSKTAPKVSTTSTSAATIMMGAAEGTGKTKSSPSLVLKRSALAVRAASSVQNGATGPPINGSVEANGNKNKNNILELTHPAFAAATSGSRTGQVARADSGTARTLSTAAAGTSTARTTALLIEAQRKTNAAIAAAATTTTKPQAGAAAPIHAALANGGSNGGLPPPPPYQRRSVEVVLQKELMARDEQQHQRLHHHNDRSGSAVNDAPTAGTTAINTVAAAAVAASATKGANIGGSGGHVQQPRSQPTASTTTANAGSRAPMHSSVPVACVGSPLGRKAPYPDAAATSMGNNNAKNAAATAKMAQRTKEKPPPPPPPPLQETPLFNVSKSTADKWFPADESGSFGCFYDGRRDGEKSIDVRAPATVKYRKHIPASHVMKEFASRLARWEPNWVAVRVIGGGMTSTIDNVVFTKKNHNPMTKPNTVASFKVKDLAGQIMKHMQSVNTQYLSHGPKDGECRVIFQMLPVQLTDYQKEKRADCHLWPKGTFLQFSTGLPGSAPAPLPLLQRKQQNHDLEEWKSQCYILDVTANILPLVNFGRQRGSAAMQNTESTFDLLCHDSQLYLYNIAICRYRTAATLSKQIQATNGVLKHLTKDESLAKARTMMQNNQVVLDSDDEDNGGGNAKGDGHITFTLFDKGVTMKTVKTPVRGRQCIHFSVRYPMRSYEAGRFEERILTCNSTFFSCC